MKLALVALPWVQANRPSSSIAALASYVRMHSDDHEVDCYYSYLDAANKISFNLYSLIATNAYEVGELIYAPMVHPEKKNDALTAIMNTWRHLRDVGALSKDLRPDQLLHPICFRGMSPTWPQAFKVVVNLLERHLEELAEALVGKYDVIGMTTCYGQLFANLALTKKIKEISSSTKILLGGSTVSGAVGASVANFYPEVDCIIQGEGEIPLLQVLDALQNGLPMEHLEKAVITPANKEKYQAGAPLSEISNMDELPIPDFEDYANHAAKYNMPWIAAVEGSRGCWWDRSFKTGNAKKTCYFCNLNIQWNGYREKSIERLKREVDEISDRYLQPSLFFLDNIIRLKGVEEFAEALIELNKEFDIFYEMRANLSPYELLKLWEAGLSQVQIGIEGLDTEYLRRIGKGTSLLQNLQAMKTCWELDIINSSNLLVNFPGATQEEVERTAHNIYNYAAPYQPLTISHFWLGIGSTLDRLQEEFPVKNIRNRDFYAAAVPQEIYEKGRFFDLSYDLSEPGADWSPVINASNWWNSQHSERAKRMFYMDAGHFLSINYVHGAKFKTKKMLGIERDLYIYCTQIRKKTEILAKFGTEITSECLDEMVANWQRLGLAAIESGRILALAPARTSRDAAKRIMQLREEDQRDILAHRPLSKSKPMSLSS